MSLASPALPASVGATGRLDAFAWLPPRLWECPRCTTVILTRDAGPRCPRCGLREGT